MALFFQFLRMKLDDRVLSSFMSYVLAVLIFFKTKKPLLFNLIRPLIKISKSMSLNKTLQDIWI